MSIKLTSDTLAETSTLIWLGLKRCSPNNGVIVYVPPLDTVIVYSPFSSVSTSVVSLSIIILTPSIGHDSNIMFPDITNEDMSSKFASALLFPMFNVTVVFTGLNILSS